jgi:hypothetical protein
MDDTSADEQPLSAYQIAAVLQALAADFEKTFPPDDWRLPPRPLSAEEWAAVTEALQCRRAFHDEGEAPRACLDEPGSEEKIRELRRRLRCGLSLFSPRDRQLHHAAGPGRALPKLAGELAAARRAEASARATAIAARSKTRISVVAGRTCEGAARTGGLTAKRMDLGAGVAPAASAAQLGDFFQYAVERSVTPPRQKSALLPIVGKDVEGKRVSIYNEGTQPRSPLLGLRLKNTSGLHLMQGPVTVFEGSTYAGDARIADLQPNEERLISYAVDLGTEVKPEVASDSGRLTHLKAVKGILYATTKLRETKTYTVRNRNLQDRLVLIELPVRNEFKLVGKDRPAETARDVYRFELNVPAGKTATPAVSEERDVGSSS